LKAKISRATARTHTLKSNQNTKPKSQSNQLLGPNWKTIKYGYEKKENEGANKKLKRLKKSQTISPLLTCTKRSWHFQYSNE
jgi:hypothetical protein